jgi:hypothetical protein
MAPITRNDGSGAGTRTQNLRINSPPRCRLRHPGKGRGSISRHDTSCVPWPKCSGSELDALWSVTRE